MAGILLRCGGRTSLGLLAMLAPMVLASCSSDDGRVPVFAVQGELLVDGKPAEGALVIFHPVSSTDSKTTNPNGRVQADGSFRLTTYEADDGAPAGEYVVTVFWPEPPKSPIDHPAMGADRLNSRFTNPETSHIRVAVTEGENVLDPIRLGTGRAL